jgi:hypothetical protein
VDLPLNGQTKTIEWVEILPGWQGRVLEWHLGKLKIAVEQPVGFRMHADDSTLALGLVHTGYTASDPDGKNAILTANVETYLGHLTPGEIQTLGQQGLTIESDLPVLPSGEWLIDIKLPSNSAEESRIRSSTGLPATVAAGGATLPVQIRWKGVDGSALYDWLTNQEAGLSLVLSGTVSATTRVHRRALLKATKLALWWNSISDGSPQIRWLGDGTAALRSAIEFGCVESASNAGAALAVDDIVAEWPQILTKFNSLLSTSPDGYSSLARTALPSGDWAVESSFDAVSQEKVSFSIQPGQLLLQHPELVQDLSGSGQGLAALKTSPSASKHAY